MKRKRFSVEQIVAILKQAEMVMPLAELIRGVGISDQTFYRWKKQFTGLGIDQVRQLMRGQGVSPETSPFAAIGHESPIGPWLLLKNRAACSWFQKAELIA